MDRTNDFSAIASELFCILGEQGFFDFEADYAKNEKSISLTMHRECYRYEIWLKTDMETIWADSVQLGFLLALESIREADIVTGEYSMDGILKKFEESGFSNIKTMNPLGAISIIGTFDKCRIVVKCTYENISQQIIALRKHVSAEAKRTGVYRGIDPRYTTKEVTDRFADNAAETKFDYMDGHEFETYCANLLYQNGYKEVHVTKGSGDQGIDILAQKMGKKYGIQCKCYSSDVGNKAVMETYAGISFYGCDIGVVLCNRNFTPAAKAMAKRTGILLWNREDLLKLIDNARLKNKKYCP